MLPTSERRRFAEKMQVERAFFPRPHYDPRFRLLALAVLLQAKDEAVCEVRGIGPSYTGGKLREMVLPHPSRWLSMQACEDWCEAAGVSVTAYRAAVLRACAEARACAA